jgi:acyl-CoA reductase-like NAD-dependent aldehyde dehydrogenase
MLKAFDEERFGPIAVITTFRTDEEAIAIANATVTLHSNPGICSVRVFCGIQIRN